MSEVKEGQQQPEVLEDTPEAVRKRREAEAAAASAATATAAATATETKK